MQPSTKQISNAYTPMSNEIAQQLTKQITGGAFGAGLGPLQQEAGTAIRQFVNSGGGKLDLTDEWKGLQELTQRNINEQGAKLNANFGSMGGRFSTGLAGAQAKMRSDATTDLSAKMGEILRQEFDARQNRLMQGIGLMQSMGTDNLMPYFNFGQLGMPSLIVGDSPFKQWSGLAQGLGSLAMAGAKLA